MHEPIHPFPPTEIPDVFRICPYCGRPRWRVGRDLAAAEAADYCHPADVCVMLRETPKPDPHPTATEIRQRRGG